MSNILHGYQSFPYEIRMSNSRGVPYFLNTETQQSTWEAPPELTKEQVKSLPGAHYLTEAGSANAGKVKASHLLVKHKDSRRPSSWKEVRVALLRPVSSFLTTFYRPISRVRRRRPSRS